MSELMLPQVINTEQLPALFGVRENGKSGIESIVEAIETEAKAIVFDINTKQGQATCRSLAAKVASAKATLDKAGKAKKDEHTVYTKLIDQDRNLAKGRLQKLQDEIRAPLTEIEEREKQRIATHEANLAAIAVDTTGFDSQAIDNAIKKLESMAIGDEWEEFKLKALEAKDTELNRIRPLFEQAKKQEAEQAELARLRAEQAEREQKEREARIAKEAEERAIAEAEAKAKRLAEETARKEREAAEREARLIAEKEAAELRAKQQAEEAAKRERDRIEAERQAEEAERIKREKDKKHRDTVFINAKDDLIANGIDEEAAKAVIKLIHAGKVRNVLINF